MTQEQIVELLSNGRFLRSTQSPELVEIHISWIILSDQFAYKIKKPVRYSFLDFSTLPQRKYYCEREIELNKRLTENIYLDVQPVYERNAQMAIGGGNPACIVDYAVRMKRVDRNKQMDILLANNKVKVNDIKRLSEKIARFHKNALIVHQKNLSDMQQELRDLAGELAFLERYIETGSSSSISHTIQVAETFLANNKRLFKQRVRDGFFRDCHGDLHSGNIFLLPEPQPFDCIEFNDSLRQIDVLNEVAFLCMDLEVLDRNDLSKLFIDSYNRIFPIMAGAAERQLFVYYKCYRANVRLKVSALRARSLTGEGGKTDALMAAEKYLLMMDRYASALQ